MTFTRYVGWCVAGVARLVAVGVAALALMILTVAGVLLLPVLGLGVPVLLGTFTLVRMLAGVERRWIAGQLATAVPEPPGLEPADDPGPGGPSVWQRFGLLVRRRPYWRYVVWTQWQAIAGIWVPLLLWLPIYTAYTMLARALTSSTGTGPLVLLPVAAAFVALPFLVCRPVMRWLATVSRRLLAAPGHRSALAHRVDELARSRAATVEAQDALIRRVERDLHDGTQAHVVSTGMTIGLARSLLHDQPDKADELLTEAEHTIAQTLQELRATVRGIRPPVLAERGLVEAVRALCLRSRVPIDQRITLEGSLDPAVETAVYFAIAEAITNLNRHASATRARVELAHSGRAVFAAVHDEGCGGAEEDTGSGLQGLRARLAALDGRVWVSSPRGGPTEIRMEVPCAPSSPKTSPSSETESSGS